MKNDSFPFGLIVLLHVTPKFALLGCPSLDATFQYQTLHSIIALVLNVVGEPSRCFGAAALTCTRGLIGTHQRRLRITKAALTAVPDYLAHPGGLEDLVD